MHYICPNCGEKSYSAASLKHLTNPYCSCGTKIEEAQNEQEASTKLVSLVRPECRSYRVSGADRGSR